MYMMWIFFAVTTTAITTTQCDTEDIMSDTNIDGVFKNNQRLSDDEVSSITSDDTSTVSVQSGETVTTIFGEPKDLMSITVIETGADRVTVTRINNEQIVSWLLTS